VNLLQRPISITAGFLGAALLLAAPAHAADSIEIDYDASGTTTLSSTGSSIALGPSVMKTYISTTGDGTLTADLPLPPAAASFNVLGFLPTTGTVSFVPAATVTGQLSAEPPLTISATARYYVKLTDVKVAGIPAFVGDHCQTVDPVTIDVATPAGQRFDITDGGDLTGSYDLGHFHDCGLSTPMLNLLLPGRGNTVAFHLSNGRFVG